MRKRYLLLLLVAVPVIAAGQTAYVTDNLRLGIHQAPDTSDRAFRTLESGQELEIVTSNRNYAQVTLPDGTQGYVKVAYLVFDKPAKLIVDETQAALEQRVAEGESALQDQSARLAELADENADFKAKQAQFQFSLPLPLVGVAMGLSLLAGFLAGLWWLDARSRRRHGGFRIY